MEHIKKYWWIYLLLLAGIFIYGYKWYSKTIQVGMGEETTDADRNCTERSSSRTELCTKPMYQAVGSAKERTWTLESDDYPFDECLTGSTITDRMGKKWFYNYQVGSKCNYIDSKQYPF